MSDTSTDEERPPETPKEAPEQAPEKRELEAQTPEADAADTDGPQAEADAAEADVAEADAAEADAAEADAAEADAANADAVVISEDGHLKVDVDTVERLLGQGAWKCVRITEDTWRGRFRGAGRKLPFMVRLDPEGYLTFAVVPFLRSPEERIKAHALYDRLLQLNQVLYMAKFSIDDDLDVVLSVEYPVEELDESEFCDCLDVLVYYADAHYEELAEIAAHG